MIGASGKRERRDEPAHEGLDTSTSRGFEAGRGGIVPTDARELAIRLFDELHLRHEGNPLPPLRSARAESLLAYLLLRRQASQPRERIAFLLWPDSSERQARTNLRHVLHNLRHALPDSDRFLEVTPRTLRWRKDAPFWLDVAAFEESLRRADEEAHEDGRLAALREAVELYAGDLLEGHYDEWLLTERERLRQLYLGALERLSAALDARGDHAQAIRYAERLLRHDPLREDAYRLLMRLHDARGDRARAIRVYHACAATLERELGIEPSAQTREAYEALLPRGRGPAAAHPRTGRVGGPPLVGRASEWARLTDLWRKCEKGEARFVLVSGEPGVGKTRLILEFLSWCSHRGAVTAEARSYPAEGALAYGPVVAWLRTEAFKARLGRVDRARLTELARVLPELLSRVPDLAPPERLPERDQRQRLFDAVARAIFSPGAPLLLVADDLQWCDRETLRFLHYLLRVAPKARLLVAATVRREEIDEGHPLNELVAGLQALERLTEIEIGRLNPEETAVLAEQLAGRAVEEPDRLYSETEGNPLFVVEALRAGWEGGGAERISPKVQAVIGYRLAQLSGPARELAGVAATIGREFNTDVLAYASESDEDALVRGLDELWRRRIVREQDTDAYDFTHDKIREVAYLALGPARRRRHHLRVARALERVYAPDPGPVGGQIAAHYERAGAIDEAVSWYGRAAEAAQLHAHLEAVRLLERALDLLRTLPETAERQETELALLAALPAPLGGIEGYSSRRLIGVQKRALELARALGTEPAPPLVRSLAIASLSRGDFAAAEEFGEGLYTRGEREADDVLLVEGEYVLGIAAFWQGQFMAARTHFEAAVDLYRPEHRPAHLSSYGLDPKVICLSRLANTLWFLGLPESAARARDSALTLAEEIRHLHSRGTALVFAAMLAVDAREPGRVRAYAASLGDDGLDRQWRPNRVNSSALNGYVSVLDGQTEEGVARIQYALDELARADHAPGMRAYLARLLLAACVTAKDERAGLAAAERALRMGGARVWEAEVRRLRAEFLAKLGAPARDVEVELDRALAVARRQEARSFELRVAVSLLRHRMERADGAGVREAHDLLAAIVDGLSEGRDTLDAREAATILARI